MGIGHALALQVAMGGSLSERYTVERILSGKDVLYWRVVLFDSPHYQARLHLFPNAAETYIHNHRSNFLSMSMHGMYIHTTWQVDQKGDGSYFESLRDEEGNISQKERKKGTLIASDQFYHTANHVYFLESQRCHKVQVPAGGNATVLTLFVRDKTLANPTTKVLELENAPEEEVDFFQDLEMTGADKTLVQRKMEDMLRSTARDLLGGDPSSVLDGIMEKK